MRDMDDIDSVRKNILFVRPSPNSEFQKRRFDYYEKIVRETVIQIGGLKESAAATVIVETIKEAEEKLKTGVFCSVLFFSEEMAGRAEKMAKENPGVKIILFGHPKGKVYYIQDDWAYRNRELVETTVLYRIIESTALY